MPEGLDNFYFCNSGSEANDLAVTIARLYTGNFSVISTRQGYHGMSGVAQGLTSIGSWNHDIPKTFGFEKTIAPDNYRGQFTGPDAGERYAEDVKQTI
jgi:alanine-glyoxylate transaminase/(R)-3-amino-2-methylpropionate-pyruvate transaminase